jgi:hypothetical protein
MSSFTGERIQALWVGNAEEEGDLLCIPQIVVWGTGENRARLIEAVIARASLAVGLGTREIC